MTTIIERALPEQKVYDITEHTHVYRTAPWGRLAIADDKLNLLSQAFDNMHIERIPVLVDLVKEDSQNDPKEEVMITVNNSQSAYWHLLVVDREQGRFVAPLQGAHHIEYDPELGEVIGKTGALRCVMGTNGMPATNDYCRLYVGEDGALWGETDDYVGPVKGRTEYLRRR